jgi:GT2 family glycosyltransferase
MPLISAGPALPVSPSTVNQTIDLSVVILNWNARDYLHAAITSIVDQVWQHTVEVIVVDNHSLLDDSVAMVRRDFPQIALIETGKNLGFSAGNNAGWRVARGRYVLFLNPDTVVHEGAFDYLIDWMDEHPEVGASGPKLLNTDGSLQASCRAFPSFGAGLFRNTLLGRLFPNNPWSRGYLMQDFQHSKEQRVDWLSGSALLVRREALEQIGGWDESYFMYCEDVDLCYRLKTKGWPRYYVPGATITHHIGKSSDWAMGAMIRRHHASMLRFYFKHYARGWGLLVAPLAVLGIGARATGAVLKLYYRYFQSGRFGKMLKNRMGRS